MVLDDKYKETKESTVIKGMQTYLLIRLSIVVGSRNCGCCIGAPGVMTICGCCIGGILAPACGMTYSCGFYCIGILAPAGGTTGGGYMPAAPVAAISP
jgi:hypothetical protein